MKIIFNAVSRRFIDHWLFRSLHLEIPHGSRMAIMGPNGSGKSTWLQLAALAQIPDEGFVSYVSELNIPLPDEKIHRHLHFSAPYLQLPEELSLQELFKFHHAFREYRQGWNIDRACLESGLSTHRHRWIKSFSSGMKQRVKLILSAAFEGDVIFWDEPATNLDETGIRWMNVLAESLPPQITLIIAGNRPEEWEMAKEIWRIADGKLIQHSSPIQD